MNNLTNPKLSVVIPTCDRAETLEHTLRTVISQKYNNLEIIICDNFSSDDTRKVVNKIKDHRINYVRTSKRLGMSENWEYALSFVRGDYVMFLGDDDGLLNNACSDISSLIKKTQSKAIIWRKPTYLDSSIKEKPNTIILNVNYDLYELKGNFFLKLVSKGLTGYGRLPVIYSGFVSMNAVNNIRSKYGKFFCSINPDIFSGIVLANEIDSYLYSLRPFSLNGTSSKSNGISSNKKSSIDIENTSLKKFVSESGFVADEDFPIIIGSQSILVADSLVQARKRKMIRSNFKINKNRYYKNIFNEIMNTESQIKYDGLNLLSQLNIPKNIKKKILKEIHLKKFSIKENYTINSYIANLGNGVIKIKGSKFNINNAFDASEFISNILGEYKIPLKILKSSFFSLLLLFFNRKIKHYFGRYFINLPE